MSGSFFEYFLIDFYCLPVFSLKLIDIDQLELRLFQIRFQCQGTFEFLLGLLQIPPVIINFSDEKMADIGIREFPHEAVINPERIFVVTFFHV